MVLLPTDGNDKINRSLSVFQTPEMNMHKFGTRRVKLPDSSAACIRINICIFSTGSSVFIDSYLIFLSWGDK
jgi:hypothetical protein